MALADYNWTPVSGQSKNICLHLDSVSIQQNEEAAARGGHR